MFACPYVCMFALLVGGGVAMQFIFCCIGLPCLLVAIHCEGEGRMIAGKTQMFPKESMHLDEVGETTTRTKDVEHMGGQRQGFDPTRVAGRLVFPGVVGVCGPSLGQLSCARCWLVDGQFC